MSFQTRIEEKLNDYLNSRCTLNEFTKEAKNLREQGEDINCTQIFQSGVKVTVAGILAMKGNIEALKAWKEAGGDVTDAKISQNGDKVTVAGILAMKGNIEALKAWKEAGGDVTDAKIFQSGVKMTVAGILATKGNIEALKAWKEAGGDVTDAQIFQSGDKVTVAGFLAGKGNIEALKTWKINLGGGGYVTSLGQSLLASQSQSSIYSESKSVIAQYQNQGIIEGNAMNVVFIDKNGKKYSANVVENQNGQNHYSIEEETLRAMFYEGAHLSGFDLPIFDEFKEKVEQDSANLAFVYGSLFSGSFPAELKKVIAKYYTGGENKCTYTKGDKEGIFPSIEDLTIEGAYLLYVVPAVKNAYNQYRNELPIEQPAYLNSSPDFFNIFEKEFHRKIKEELKKEDHESSSLRTVDSRSLMINIKNILVEKKLSLGSTKIIAAMLGPIIKDELSGIIQENLSGSKRSFIDNYERQLGSKQAKIAF